METEVKKRGTDLHARVEKSRKITIALPVFEEREIVARFISGNKEILEKYPLLVIDRKGGETLRKYASFYRKTCCPAIGWPLGSSRRFLIGRVQTEYTLNLDVDVVLPKHFVKESLKKFEDPKVAVVALDYENPQGHLAFGPSIWRTDARARAKIQCLFLNSVVGLHACKGA